MAETSIQTMHPKQSYNGFSQSMSESSNESALSQRRIEFHPVRKPINGFSNGCGDFKLDTLNFSSSDSCLQVSNSVQSVFGGKKTDGSENFDSGLDPELSFGITFRRIGAGLYNLGNTCFLNSVLQCLTYTEPFAAYLQSGKHQNSCHIVGFCALCALQKHVSRALQSTGTSLSPDDLVRNLRCISRNFRNSRQEDAHEYMVNLLECMHRCCLPSGVHSESPSAYEKSLVHKIFGGRLRSQVKCLQCSHCSNTYDSFLDLSLEIVKADSLKRALANFTAAEQLDGGEKQYQCQLCREKVCALKQLTVDKPPYVLTIHLKRFHAYDLGQKIDKKIMFGSTLDLKPFVSESYEGGLKYTLYGVLVHYGGSTDTGHYSCFVRTSSGVWYSLDDNQVVQVSEKIVLEQRAYMLFYVRDRRNISSKKPSSVIQKENLRPNNNGTRIFSDYKLDLTRQTQNGPVEDRSTGTASSAAIRLDELDISLAKTPHPNEASSHPMQEPPLEASLSKDSLKGVFPSSNGENPPPSNNFDASSLKNGTASVTGCNANNFDEKEVSTENCGVLVATSSLDSEESQRSVKHLREQTSNKNCSISPVEDYCVASPQDTCGRESQKIDSIKPLGQQRCEKIQVETVSHESAAGKPLGENAGDSGQNLVNDDSINLSGSSNTLGFLNVEASGCKSPKKLKKKVLKCHATRGILFRQSLSIRKKKKHKKSKNRPLGTKNLSNKCLMDTKYFPSDLGPSTSENTHKAPLDCTRSKQKRAQCVSKKEAKGTVAKEVNAQSDSSTNVVDGEFRQRIDQNGSVLATCDQPQNNTGSADRRNAKETGNLQMYNTDGIQNKFVGMLTRGLEETVVGRWDDVELPSQTVESTAVVENIHIGYVADEWDEEYDQGKRKKVRQSKHNFGGPNPFQEIATGKMQLKKTKRDGSNSGNQPFRI